jgi:hypothetical protein
MKETQADAKKQNDEKGVAEFVWMSDVTSWRQGASCTSWADKPKAPPPPTTSGLINVQLHARRLA